MASHDGSEDDDPFNWTIDDVIKYFCHNPYPSWSPDKTPPYVVHAEFLEKTLRENDVNGETLLEIESQATLRDELGLSSLGVRISVMKAIRHLQSKSRKFQPVFFQADAINRYVQGSLVTPQATGSRMSAVVQSSVPGVGTHSPDLQARPDVRSPSFNNWNGFPHQTTPVDRVLLSTPDPRPSIESTEPSLSKAEASTSDHVVSLPMVADQKTAVVDQDYPTSQFLSSQNMQAPDASRQTPEANPLLDDLEARLDITLGEGESRRHIDAEVARKTVQEPSFEHALGIKARKRVAPTLVQHISESRIRQYHTEKLRSVGEPQSSQYVNSYFEPQGRSVESIFYPTDSELDQEVNLATQHPQGMRKYVNNIMQSFLKRPAQRLPGHRAKVRIPYKLSSMIALHEPQYVTVFAPALESTTRNISDLPSLHNITIGRRRSDQVPQIFSRVDDIDRPTNPFEVPEEHAEADEDSFFDYLAQKYPTSGGDGNEDDLPLYGDSGDEGEYDEATWDEIQKEVAERSKAHIPTYLSTEQITAAMDEAIRDQERAWHATKFPKVQLRAYRRWMKAAKERRRQAEIDDCLYWMNRYSAAIEKVRDAILRDTWSSAIDVKHQCMSFEELVNQRMEQRIIQSALLETHPPPKPTSSEIVAARQKQPRPVTTEPGEEVLDSEEEALDSFIVEHSSDAESVSYDAQDAESQDQCREKPHQSPSDPSVNEVTLARASDWSPSSRETSLAHAEPPASLSHEQITDTASRDGDDDTDSDEQIYSPADRKRTADRARHNNLIHNEKAKANIVLDGDEPGGTSSDRDSDLDRPPPLPQSKYRRQGRSEHQAIDLTLSSSPSRYAQDDSVSDFSIRTPDINLDSQEADDPQKIKIKLKLRSPATPETASQVVSSVEENLPTYTDVDGIRSLPWDIIEGNSDNRRALAKAVYRLPLEDARNLDNSLKTTAHKDALLRSLHRLPQLPNEAAKLIPGVALGLLFITYCQCLDLMKRRPVPKVVLDEALVGLDGACIPFFNALFAALNAYCNLHTPKKKRKLKEYLLDSTDDLPDDSDILLTQDSEMEETDVPERQSSHKKRKRAVELSQEAAKLQMNDRRRVEDQERRRLAIKQKLQAMGITSENPAARMINTDLDHPIYLDPHIGSRIKPHQVEGVMFMWREVTSGAGCLLAHTMGLGKTMQVISLLYTIAQCGKSPDAAIRNQVPVSLRNGIRALVLFPASLTDNWQDEIFMWASDVSVVGETYQMAGNKKRFAHIKKWATSTGFLLMGYEMFRILIHSKSKDITEEEHAEIQDYLLNAPNVVVADEAHKLKNAGSKVALAASQFKTMTRIALTGSPLNNHLEEYHTMINWVAPNYLGSLVQFKVKYSEPIQEGLYAESSPYEKKLALRKLHVLKRDLDAKINRADITAITQDMPVKTEYFITLALTLKQAKAYELYAKFVLQGGTKIKTASLFQCLSILSLLCNHPAVFVKKLLDRLAATKLAANKLAANAQTQQADSDDEEAQPDDVSPPDLGVPAEAMRPAIEVFEEETQNDTLNDIELSHRTAVVCQIVQESLAIGDKVLIFSHSIPTLDYLEDMLIHMNSTPARIDGSTTVSKRQGFTKAFNDKKSIQQVFLISMRAGGLGLNLQGANRVIIFDFQWNPTWEEQAVGRAYRLGQKKPVYVYRFRAGGTFEHVLNNKAVFKTQLFQRVVDKKNYKGVATRDVAEYVFEPQEVKQENLTEFIGKDPDVLDKIINRVDCIRNIELTETFQKPEDIELTADEVAKADEEWRDEKLFRDDPDAYKLKQIRKHKREQALQQASRQQQSSPKKLPAATTALASPPSAQMQATTQQSTVSTYPAMPSANVLTGAQHPTPSNAGFGNLSLSNLDGSNRQTAGQGRSAHANGDSVDFGERQRSGSIEPLVVRSPRTLNHDSSAHGKGAASHDPNQQCQQQ